MSAEIRRAWWYPLLTTEPDAARTTIFAAIDELEEAKTILLAEPDPAGDTFLEAVVFATRGLTYRMAAASVRQDETDEIDRLTALAIKVEQEAADFQARHPQELEPAPVVLGACAEISWRADAALALGEGRYDDAIAAWQRYIETFGDDPGALIDLGWNQYLAGDVAAARDTTARVETLAPDEPVAAANSALIEAASGRPEEALSAVDRLVEDLESLTPASQMASATSFIRDLGDLAGARAETREVVRSMSTRLSGWIVAQQPPAFDRYAAVRIMLADGFVRTSLAIGDTKAAHEWCDRGLAINEGFAALLAHCAMVDAVTGEADWRSQAEAAIDAATAYGPLMQESPLAAQAQPLGAAELAAAARDARVLTSVGGSFAAEPDIATIATMLEDPR